MLHNALRPERVVWRVWWVETLSPTRVVAVVVVFARREEERVEKGEKVVVVMVVEEEEEDDIIVTVSRPTSTSRASASLTSKNRDVQRSLD